MTAPTIAVGGSGPIFADSVKKRKCNRVISSVLRIGTKHIYGVGVVGEYSWCDEFNDVDGWDLGHTRRVRWLWRYDVEGNCKPKDFDTYEMKLGDTTQHLDAPAVVSWLESLQVPDAQTSCSLPDLPHRNKDEGEVSTDEIADFLFQEGIASDSIRNLLDKNGEFIRIANWYNGGSRGHSPSEHETVSHLVIPLLRILGWTPQRMALEGRELMSRCSPECLLTLDIFLWSSKRRRFATPVCRGQCIRPRTTQRRWSLQNCRRLVVTDGLRYGVYKRVGTDFRRYAYLNLTRLRNEYPIYNCKGAKEAILAMNSRMAS